MTVGSFDNKTSSGVGCTSASYSSTILNGTTISWSGADSAVKRRLKGLTRKERVAYFLEKPKSQLNRPYLTRKLDIDPSAIQSMFTRGNLFDQIREKRLRVIEPVDQGDYRTPHAFTKSWSTNREPGILQWTDGGMRYDQCLRAWTAVYTGTLSNNGWWPSTTALSYNAWEVQNDGKLLERLRRKVVGSDFNLASFLGAEGLDTLAFITDISHRVARAMVLAKKGRWAQASASLTSYGRVSLREKSTVRDLAAQRDVYDKIARQTGIAKSREHAGVVAAQWLEFHLAAEPLVGDVIAAAEQLAHITNARRTQRVAASFTQTRPYPSIDGPQWKGVRKIRKAVVCYFNVTPDPIAFTGLTDPEVTIWNAIPLSFVADYFFDFGGWLEARATASAFGTGVFVTSVKDEWILTECLGHTGPGFVHKVLPDLLGQKASYRQGSFTRTVASSLSDLVQKPKFEPLGALKNWQRAATAVSLVAAFSSRARLPAGSLR